MSTRAKMSRHSASGRPRDAEELDDLERRGVIRRGSGSLPPDWLASRPRVTADVVRALLEERDEGR